MVAAAIALMACAAPVELDLTDAEIVRVAETWVNTTGLVQSDASVWRTRLGEACTEGVWDEGVASGLAERYVTEDLDLAMDGVEDDLDLRDRAADALWLMARRVCSDEFPEGEIEDGPPGVRSTGPVSLRCVV